MSEGERLYIDGHYEMQVTGNLRKVIETLQEAIQTYPTQISNYINISVAYNSLGQFEKALSFSTKAVEIDPLDSIASQNVITDYLALGRMPEAQAEVQRARRMGLDKSTEDITMHLLTHFMLGEKQDVQTAMIQVAGRPDEFLATQALGATQMFSGQFKQAAATTAHAFDQAGRAKAPDVQASLLLIEAATRGLAGVCAGNEAALQRAHALDKSKVTEESLLMAAGVCGNSEAGQQAIQGLTKKFPDDTLVQNAYVPIAQGFLSLAAGHAQQAVGRCRIGQEFRCYLSGIVCAGAGVSAIARCCSCAECVSGSQSVQSGGAGYVLSALLCAGAVGIGARLRHGWRTTRTPEKPMRRSSPYGRMQMQTCPCWWLRRRNTLRFDYASNSHAYLHPRSCCA